MDARAQLIGDARLLQRLLDLALGGLLRARGDSSQGETQGRGESTEHGARSGRHRAEKMRANCCNVNEKARQRAKKDTLYARLVRVSA